MQHEYPRLTALLECIYECELYGSNENDCSIKVHYQPIERSWTMTSVTASSNLHELQGIHPTGKEIGRGAYGRVFEVDYEGTLCAAKEVHALLLQSAQGGDLQKIKDDFLSECQIWSTLRHPCVIQFLGSVILVV